eukprot:gene2030-2352_t
MLAAVEGTALLSEFADCINPVLQLAGPPGTPYEGGWFHVELVFTKNFPGSQPKAVFKTPIYHPNIDKAADAAVNPKSPKPFEPRVCQAVFWKQGGFRGPGQEDDTGLCYSV